MRNALAFILENKVLGQTQAEPSRAHGNVFFSLHRSGTGNPKADFEQSQYSQVQSNFLYLQRKLSSSSITIKQEISIDSRIMHGNPVFKGTRIPLYRIIEELADGTRLEELIDGYPSLNLKQIQAGLDFTISLLRIYDD
jgi:uncharacterized protein (DUF433 family)